MKKKFLLLSFFLLPFLSFAQSALSTGRIGEMLKASRSVEFSEKILSEIKLFSALPGSDARQVAKNTIYLQTLFNEDLPVADRLAFSEMVIRQFDRSGTGQSEAIPLDLIRKLQLDLQKH